MARAMRTEYPGALYHVTSRGHQKKPLFLDDADREHFLKLVEQVARRYRWIITAYVLMTNHYHFVIETPQPNLGRGMKLLNSAYASWFNKRHGRIHSLFGERYKAILIEKQAYLQRVTRYVVLNPVRAGMVARPEDYPWSSYQATAGLAEAPSWLSLEQLVPYFGEIDTWRANYVSYVNEKCATEERLWVDLRRRFFLSSEAWLKTLKKVIRGKLRHDDHPTVQRLAGAPSVHAIATAVAMAFDMTVQDLRATRGGAARMMTAWIAWYEGAHRLRKIAAVLRLRSQGHISGLVRAAEQEISKRPELQRKLGLVYAALA